MVVMTTPRIDLQEAQRLTGLSDSTLRRRLPQLAELGAARDAQGVWQIPVPALVQLGLMPPVTRPDAAVASEVTSQSAADAAEVAQLRSEVATWRQRALVAEAVADERGQRLDDLRIALRLLAPAPAPATAPAAVPTPAAETAVPASAPEATPASAPEGATAPAPDTTAAPVPTGTKKAGNAKTGKRHQRRGGGEQEPPKRTKKEKAKAKGPEADHPSTPKQKKRKKRKK